jgi:uncharacterized membrane protein
MELKQRKNRGAGLALLVIAVSAFIIYAYALFFSQWSIVVIQATLLGVIGVLLLVVGWIGYTMLTAPRAEEMPK